MLDVELDLSGRVEVIRGALVMNRWRGLISISGYCHYLDDCDIFLQILKSYGNESAMMTKIEDSLAHHVLRTGR